MPPEWVVTVARFYIRDQNPVPLSVEQPFLLRLNHSAATGTSPTDDRIPIDQGHLGGAGQGGNSTGDGIDYGHGKREGVSGYHIHAAGLHTTSDATVAMQLPTGHSWLTNSRL